jgi:hypothetical protein
LGVLCWLRSVSRFDPLPVVILADGCSSAQSDILARLRAACCNKGETNRDLMPAIAQSIRNALRVAHGTGEAGESSLPQPENCPLHAGQ